MSNKTEIQTLNAKYESLIEELRGKAAGGGSGGSVETVEVTFVDLSIGGKSITYIRLTDKGLNLEENSSSMAGTIVVPANSKIAFNDGGMASSVESSDGSSYSTLGGVWIGTSNTTITIGDGSDNPWG